MKWSTGTRFNFSIAAGLREVVKLRVGSAGALSGLNVANAAFSFQLIDAQGVAVECSIEHGEEVGVLYLTLPVVASGTYRYELSFTDDAGERGLLLHGEVTALTRVHFETLEEAAAAADVRELVVSESALHGGPLGLRWAASSAAARYAAEAKAAAGSAEDIKAAVEEFRVFAARWQEDIVSVLVMNPTTGTIWVGGVDTGQPYQGEHGKAPRVNAYGFWEVYENGQWVTLPYIAAGKDGLDGDQVRRVLLGSVEELPEGEERGVIYYTPRESGGYDMWCWLENAGWVCFGGDPYGVATETSLGLVLLGTGVPVEGGAPVGADLAKKLAVPRASTTVAGVGKLSSDSVSEVGGGIHMTLSGSLLTDVATAVGFGSVKVSTSEVLTEGGIVGMNAAGQLLVKRATPSQMGAVLPGSFFKQLLGKPYQQAVGVDGQGRLANCFVVGGALQHRLPKQWLNFKNGSMPWMDYEAFPDKDEVEQAHYTGLVTTGQFTQSEARGLELLAATTTRLAGVTIAASPTDDGAAAVPLARDVEARYALKEESYTRDDVENLLKAFVRMTETWHGTEVMTEEAYNAMGDKADPKVQYILI
ncbi:MAG: hypothetical protein IJN29_04065 [Akkermansia sp.]|nr:hypothetical protein [Akkermansia sp.]